MSILDSIKPFWPLLFTFVLPRALNYYQALKLAFRTRPPPRPLPNKASRSLNVLFVSVCVFLWLSISSGSTGGLGNVFATTQARLAAPNQVVFARLAMTRPSGTLTAADEALKEKLSSMPLRKLYLRYGPATISNCLFCHPDEPLTYFLHHIPSHILFPHLLHVFVLGLATSRSIAGPIPFRFRIKSVFAALALLALDMYITTAINLDHIDINMPSPPSIYNYASILRPLSLCLFDAGLALLIYVTATGRFLLLPFLASASAAEDEGDPEEVMQQTNKLLNETNVALQMAQMKLRGLNVVQNTVVRNEELKKRDAQYWEQVRRVEATDGFTGMHEKIFEDEEVQRAMARAFGGSSGADQQGGGINVEKMKKEAEGFVKNVTKGLDSET